MVTDTAIEWVINIGVIIFTIFTALALFSIVKLSMFAERSIKPQKERAFAIGGKTIFKF